MRRVLLTFGRLFVLLLPLEADARGYSDWSIRNDNDMNAWNAAGVEKGMLTAEGFTFAVHGNVVFYRTLPEGFAGHIDGIKLYVGPSKLTEVALLLLKTAPDGSIERRMRLPFVPDRTTLADGEYVPLALYREEVKGAHTLAVSFVGDADAVTFRGVRLLAYSPWEKLIGLWRSFFMFEGFPSYGINLLVGPVLIPDNGPLETVLKDIERMISVNAYLYFLLAISGVSLLLAAVRKARQGVSWPVLRMQWLQRFFAVLLVVWLLYDLRMGMDFLAGVHDDYVQYIAAPPGKRTFRDIGRFPDFLDVARPFVTDRKQYEFLLEEPWPYFGIMRYAFFPALPNEGEPVSDTWLVYEREDITVTPKGELARDGAPFTRPGSVLARLDAHSFVFREGALQEHAKEYKEYKEDKEYNEDKAALGSLNSLYSLSSLSSF